MRSAALLTFAMLVLSERAVTQEAPNVTPDLQAMEAKLLTRMGPETRTWIKQEAVRENASTTISEATTLRAVASYPYARGLGDADIMAIAFVVMMEAAKSAREDLKAIMASVKAMNDAKAAYLQSINRSPVRSKEELECLDRLTEMESLRLQMARDRLAKFMSTLSNIMKKVASTEASITQNLK